MPRKKFTPSHDFPYHIYNRTLDKVFYSLPMNHVWDIFMDHCRIITWAFGVKIHAFVLMGNHYHLLATTPYRNLNEAMCFFQSRISTAISIKTNCQKFRFGCRYKWSLISQARHYQNVYKYVLQNPVRAQICKLAEDYPWSTLNGISGLNKLDCPLYPQDLFEGCIPESILERIDWINSCFVQTEVNEIRKSLAKTTYK